ncbi:hypothetical protein FPQ18DRAFT_325595 [Pyronema domesticum]|nr:hypothetical protein FPQ18DRAFT_325595 [Pyronema domesticum]
MVIDFSNSNVADGTVPVVKRAENLEILMGDFDIGYTQLLFGEHGSFSEYDDHLTEEPGVVMPNMAEMPGSMPVVPGPPAIPGPPAGPRPPTMPQIPGGWPVTPGNSMVSVSTVSTIPDMPGNHSAPQMPGVFPGSISTVSGIPDMPGNRPAPEIPGLPGSIHGGSMDSEDDHWFDAQEHQD